MRILILGSAVVLASLQGISHVAGTLQTNGFTINGTSMDGLLSTGHSPTFFRNSVSVSGNQSRTTSGTPQVRTNPSLTQTLRAADGSSPVTSFSPGPINTRR